VSSGAKVTMSWCKGELSDGGGGLCPSDRDRHHVVEAEAELLKEDGVARVVREGRLVELCCRRTKEDSSNVGEEGRVGGGKSQRDEMLVRGGAGRHKRRLEDAPVKVRARPPWTAARSARPRQLRIRRQPSSDCPPLRGGEGVGRRQRWGDAGSGRGACDGVPTTKGGERVVGGREKKLSVFRTSLRQVNLLYAFRAPKGVRGGRKVYTGSVRTSLLPVIGGLRYQHH
jgi:hypothetical protein